MNAPTGNPALAASAGSAVLCAHGEQPPMGYAEWHEDADRRIAAGQTQYKCPVCKCWIWSEFWKSPNAPGEPRRTDQ